MIIMIMIIIYIARGSWRQSESAAATAGQPQLGMMAAPTTHGYGQLRVWHDGCWHDGAVHHGEGQWGLRWGIRWSLDAPRLWRDNWEEWGDSPNSESWGAFLDPPLWDPPLEVPPLPGTEALAASRSYYEADRFEGMTRSWLRQTRSVPHERGRLWPDRPGWLLMMARYDVEHISAAAAAAASPHGMPLALALVLDRVRSAKPCWACEPLTMERMDAARLRRCAAAVCSPRGGVGAAKLAWRIFMWNTPWPPLLAEGCHLFPGQGRDGLFQWRQRFPGLPSLSLPGALGSAFPAWSKREHYLWPLGYQSMLNEGFDPAGRPQDLLTMSWPAHAPR